MNIQPFSNHDLYGNVHSSPLISESSRDSNHLKLTKKARTVLQLYIQQYQATTVGDFSRQRLVEVRGCGKGIAEEILCWLESVGQSSVVHLVAANTTDVTQVRSTSTAIK